MAGAIRRYGPMGLLRLVLAVEGQADVDVSLSRFGAEIADWREFWVKWFGPKFFEDVQANFDREGAAVGGWKPLSPAYAAWKARHYPGRKILERTLRLRRSLTWHGGLFASGGFRGGLGREGIFRPNRTSLEAGTGVPYGLYHQRGARARQRGLDARGRLRSRRTGRFISVRGAPRSVVTGRYARGLPQRRFLFLQRTQNYGRLLHLYVAEKRKAAGLSRNRYGTGGVSGSGLPFTRPA